MIDGRGVVEVAVVGSNSLGDHVTGNVRLSLPTAVAGVAAAVEGGAA